MNTRFKLLMIFVFIFLINLAFGQDHEIKTLFNSGPYRSSGGYGAIGNKFTTINGEFANLVEVYGGWYINHRFLLGLEAAAGTNNVSVPEQFSTLPGEPMNYEYGQFGLMTEYTLWSHRAVHLSFHVMNGAGFTVQYRRFSLEDDDPLDSKSDYPRDSNWFFVSEPGVKLEMNVFRWLRFSPGVSYRATFGSDAAGLSDERLSDVNYNLTLKFGKF